jgi:hypothetical protein
VVLAAGTTYRFGDSIHNLWSVAITVDVATTISPVSMNGGNPFPFSDPDDGTVKELDVLQTAGAQTIAVTDLSVSPAATVSMIVPGLATPTAVPMTPGTAYTLTFSNFTVASNTGLNPASVAFVNSPPTQANRGWEGTQLNLTIDGVTFVCTSGPSATDDSMTLTCTVPQPPSS